MAKRPVSEVAMSSKKTRVTFRSVVTALRSKKSQSSSLWSVMPLAPRQPPTRWMTPSTLPAASATVARRARTLGQAGEVAGQAA